jgi:hypothetical protein
MMEYRTKFRLSWMYVYAFINGVGASRGNLPHVKNFDDQATLTQIGIQATAR